MGGRRREWTQAKFEQYIQEGRGQGTREHYKPWITIHDFSSNGWSKRTSGWKTNRLHHFLSSLELKLFFLLEWSDIVIDVREQFPLLDLDLAEEIAAEAGIRYPKDPKSGAPYVLTTDFMLTLDREGQKVDVARTVKPAKELDKTRVIEKLELERRYWAVKGISWGIVTEKQIPTILASNIDWVYSAYRLEATVELTIAELRDIAKILKHRLHQAHLSINRITANLDAEMNLEPGISLYLFRHLVARKEIEIDMRETKISVCPSARAIKHIIMNPINERISV